MNAETTLKKPLAHVFDRAREGLRQSTEPAQYEKARSEFVFHITDWLANQREFADFLTHPEKYDAESSSTLLIGFLYHVVPHSNTAGRLLLDEIPDPFAPRRHPAQIS